MRRAPSIVPSDRLDRDIYLVLDDFGARAGCAWRETDERDTDLETVLRGLLSGEYTYPVRVACSNPGQGRAREVTSDIADTLAQRAANSDQDVPEAALRDFIAANATRRFDIQLALLGPKRQHRWLFISTDAATLLAVSFLTVFS